MNKELIKKYKAEFDHWLNGGKLQARFVYDQWVEAPKDIFSFNAVNFVLVIDDEHVEFRKALAEGKIVEFKHPRVGYDKWEIVTPEHLFQSVVPGREYRIKPEEPKFKVGDWVIFEDNTKHKITEINKFSYTFNNNFSCGFETHTVLSMKHWKPKKDELVILKNKNDIISIIKYNGETNVHPFIGEITWLHKKD